MSTNVNTWAYPGDDILGGPNNTLRTKGKSPSNSSSADRLAVKYNNKFYPVETRYNKTDGSSAGVIVVRETRTRTVTTTGRNASTKTESYEIDVPIVLYTTDSNGNTTLGGKGELDRPGVARGFSGVGSQTTTADQASSIISTAVGKDNAAITQDEFFKVSNGRVDELYKSTNPGAARAERSNIKDAVAPQTTEVPTEAAPAGESTGPGAAPHDQSSTGETTTDGTQPGNNESTAGQQEQKSYITKIQEGIDSVVDYITIDEKDIAALEAKLADGGGDTIQGGRYPLDANYGNYYGQDYCCIDQFRYQAPRKEQIFSKDPISNYSQGNLRITPLKEFVAKVDLPMPNTLADSNNVSWGADVMNNLSAAITSGALKNPGMVAAMAAGANAAGAVAGIQGLGTLGALAGVMASASDKKGTIDKLKDIPNVAKQAITGDSQLLIQSAIGSRILAAAGVEVSPETLLARGLGVVPNSNMELLFNAPTLREFSFNWRLSPRDAREAAEVKKIIRFFKQGMAARTISSQAGDRSLFLGTPNIFRIQFKTANGQIIEGVNRIKPCAVTGTSVNYTPEGAWAAYDQGQPVSTVLSIRMQELEPVYASDYSEDVIGNRASGEQIYNEQFVGPLADPNQAVTSTPAGIGDLYSIRPSEVGY